MLEAEKNEEGMTTMVIDLRKIMSRQDNKFILRAGCRRKRLLHIAERGLCGLNMRRETLQINCNWEEV